MPLREKKLDFLEKRRISLGKCLILNTESAGNMKFCTFGEMVQKDLASIFVSVDFCVHFVFSARSWYLSDESVKKASARSVQRLVFFSGNGII